MDGGISSPRVLAPPSEPMTRSGGYPRSVSSGIVILPMVAQVAADEPDTAAKMVLPRMLVCSSRPGSTLTQGARPLNMLSDSLVRNRISPIQTNSGSAVSVQLLAEPQMVTAIASPALREENSSMPIQATPASVRPIQTPLPSNANKATISKPVTAISFMVGLRSVEALTLATGLQHPFIHNGNEQHQRAQRHRQLGNPQRRGVVAGGDVVELDRLPHQAHSEPGKQAREQHRHAQRPQLQAPAGTAFELAQHQRDADVLVALERVRQRQEAGGGHGVAGVGVRARHVELELPPQHRQQHHDQHADHEHRREPGAAVVQGIEHASHGAGRPHLRNASTRACPSGPALASHSLSKVSPTFCMSAFSCAEAGKICMPPALSLSRLSPFAFLLASQPRVSASAAAFRTASCVGLSSASKAFLFTSSAFLGNQAWVSYQYFTCSYSLASAPVEPLDIMLSVTPVAKAWLTSAACTVTGCAPTSSAMRAVAGL